jgi:UDPglucose 6-dehydrogenase
MPRRNKICIIGTWHLGSVVSACFADLGYNVIGADQNTELIESVNKGIPPLFEPGLEELIRKNLKTGRLNYTSHLVDAVRSCDHVLITYDTPVGETDEVDLSGIFATVKDIAAYLENGTVITVSSQVPVGTCDQIKASIQKVNPELNFDIAYSPENLRLGQAIECFLYPDRIVVGAENDATLEKVEKLFSVINAPVIRMNLKTAEMTKHAINAFLATSISFANEIGNLCDEVGADAFRLAQALASDTRIGPHLPLSPGLAFGGGTLARDLKILQELGDRLHYHTWLINGVVQVNEQQKKLVTRKLEKIYGSVGKLTVGVLGLAYKAGTSTLRRSTALEIIGRLVYGGASVKAYDPRADIEEVRAHREFEFCDDPYQTARDSDALVIATDWPEFLELDFDLIKSVMKKPVLIDAKNMLDGRPLLAKGFLYSGVGTGLDYAARK